MADKSNYLSRVTYKGGKDSYEFPFSYLRKDFVKAQIDVSEHESNTLAYLVDYTIDGHTIELKKPVDADKTITIYRETSSTPLVEYEDSSILRAYDLNLSQRQNLNILEEQTDIVEKNYSLSQDTKDYMYKNLMDTKTAIDNKMSETLDTVDSKLATVQADVQKAVSDTNASLNETKQSVNASVSTMNDIVNTTKKSVEDSLAEMNTTVANTKKSVEDSLATTTTNLNDALNTATSSMDNKISQASQALEDAKANLETTKSDIEKALADTQDSLKDTENRVNETKADITKLADEFKESESSLQDAIKNINSTNRNMSYEVGDQIHSSYLPFNCYITCVTAGTTGDTLPVIPEGDHDSGFTYTDGTATFKMDYWPLSINGKKPLNKAGDITLNVDKVKEAEKADTATNANHAGTADTATNANHASTATTATTANSLKETSTRPASANVAYNDGKIRYFLATSGMSVGKPSGGDGPVMHLSWDRPYWESQIAFNSPSGHLQTRAQAGAAEWGSWNTVLDSDNYNNYAPTKTGGGASGTWGINVSGNSATATKATQDSAGQQINTTYIKGLSVSGATLTITKGNGVTSTATINQTAGMLPATRVLQGGGTKLYSYNGGLDSGDITLSQAFTNFKYLVIFLSFDNQAQDLYVTTVETAALYQAMAGNNTYWPGNKGASEADRVFLSRGQHVWTIYNIKGGSSTTFLKHFDDDLARLYSIYGIN